MSFFKKLWDLFEKVVLAVLGFILKIFKKELTDDQKKAIEDSGLIGATNGVAVGGWFVTYSGTASYKYRVVAVDGVAVAEPTLKNLCNGGTTGAGHAITNIGVGLGYPTDCGIGAQFQAQNVVNLAGFEGHTVNVEIVAVTKNGNNVVIMILSNVAVPAAE